jgi:hypothetical protein
MAAIARSFVRVALPVIFGAAALASQESDVLEPINRISTALADGNPSDAIAAFDRSFAGYDRLRDYFKALTSSFSIVNEASVVDEEDAREETKLTLQWTLTLTNLTTNQTDSRSSEVEVRMLLKDGRWKIVDFSPIDMFDPQAKHSEQY